MREKHFPVVALVLAVTGLAAWRAACVLTGPDIDTDAYAHHMIARAILANPRDLAVHWVWLPLFHYLQVPLVALGGTMNDVRWANVVLSAAIPLALYAYVRRTANGSAGQVSPQVTALSAALFAAACPIAMQMGTTAQPEPLFALLTLGVAVAFERRRYGATGAMLGAAVLLRYEGWAILAAVGAFVAWDVVRAARVQTSPVEPKVQIGQAWVAVALPVACIGAWAILRRPVDGKWFGFLGQTHEFASEVAQRAHNTPERAIRFVQDVLYYPLIVPVRVLGPTLPLAAFGISRTWREQGARFVAVFLAVLAFVSFSWVCRATLGLDRHFVAVVPLYATFAAQGATVLAEGIAERVGRGGARQQAGELLQDLGPAKLRLATACTLSGGALAALAVMLVVWMGFWRGSIARGWPERAQLGAYLRSLPAATTIFCDDATLEILSGLDRHRFDRHWVDDPQTWTLVDEAARAKGVAYVATWRRKLRGHEDAGEIVFHASDTADSFDTGVAVLRVRPEIDRAAQYGRPL